MDVNGKDPSCAARRAYDEALRASHREAAATMLAAILTVLYFWGTVFLWEKSELTLFSLPLWFVASCVGGYLFSVVAVWILVKRCFTEIALDEVAEAYRRSEEKPHD